MSHSTSTPDVTEAVVLAVADAADADPLEIEPLYDAVDPDALTRLVDHAGERSGSSDLTMTFTMHGLPVRVDGDGSVTVETDASRTEESAARPITQE